MQTLPAKLLDKASELTPRHDGVAIDIDDLVSFKELDELVGLAKSIYGTGAAFVTIMGREYQWFLAETGMDMRMGPAQSSICKRIVHERGECIIGDAMHDPDLVKNAFVTGKHGVRFYAGVPIRVKRPDTGGVITGTFCIADRKPRDPGEFDKRKLEILASLAHTIIEARVSRAIAVEALDRQMEAMVELDRSDKLFRTVERMADMGSWRYDLETREHQWSEGVYAIHGISPESAPPINDAWDFYPANARERVEKTWVKAVRDGMPFDLEVDFRTASGSKKRIRVVGEPEYRDKKIIGVIGMMSDVTAQYAMQRALKREAMTDALTGLPNRAGFHVHFAERLAAAENPGDLALLVVDLDGFKSINDRAGHLAGDRALVKCARIIDNIVNGHGFAARYGGDEFVVILSNGNVAETSKKIAKRLTEELRFEVENSDKSTEPLTLGATTGVAYNAADDAMHDIIHRADIAMYEAKRALPGTVKIAQSH